MCGIMFVTAETICGTTGTLLLHFE